MAKIKTKGQENKVYEYYLEAVDFFEKYKKNFYIGGIVLIAIVLVIFIYFKRQAANNEAAGLELNLIKPVYLAGNFQQAVYGDSTGTAKGLLYIVDNYGSSENGETAKILLGNSFLALRDIDNAEKYFKDFSGGNPFLKAASYAGIASVYEARGQYLKAAEEYVSASKVSSEITNVDEYLFYAVRNYFWAEDYENAKNLIEKIKTEFPKSQYISLSERYNHKQ
jgi:tetratricopeptide (TPR) repeat protein